MEGEAVEKMRKEWRRERNAVDLLSMANDVRGLACSCRKDYATPSLAGNYSSYGVQEDAVLYKHWSLILLSILLYDQVRPTLTSGRAVVPQGTYYVGTHFDHKIPLLCPTAVY